MLSSKDFRVQNYYTDGSATYKYIGPDDASTDLNFTEILIFENMKTGNKFPYSSSWWKKLTLTNPYRKTGGLKSKRLRWSSRWSSRWSKKRKSKLRIKSIRKSRKHHKK